MAAFYLADSLLKPFKNLAYGVVSCILSKLLDKLYLLFFRNKCVRLMLVGITSYFYSSASMFSIYYTSII